MPSARERRGPLAQPLVPESARGCAVMTRIGVISNPLSSRNRRGLHALDRVLARHPGILHTRLEGISDVGAALEDFARREVGLVVVNGGDGTVQAVLSELLGRRPEALPLLAVLGRGMTNMIAGDVGLKGGLATSLARLVAAAEGGGLEQFVATRQVIRMVYPPAGPPRYGMFFGTAAICRAIAISRGAVQPLGIKDPAATALTFTGLVLRRLARGGRPDGFFRGDAIALSLDGRREPERSYFLLLVTTLESLVLGTGPFWGGGEGALRLASIADPPPRLLRSLLPFFYGGGGGRLPPEYASRRGNTVSLAMTCPFTLDGELFEPGPDAAVTLEAAGPARFVTM